ncbi:hypothetical protein Poly30_01300 [Planctomycetes bacterium Poly30]|uniref:Nucleotidyl transferase AbiEii toxin, Type IV TA system n=1 Tax=Saltatorellus ferox TaxID=2528018 RepID=A0A518EKM0_9BACT|nr:hypothetical protein Poly30_01300 [Planctomycetes bacterium Poly30]
MTERLERPATDDRLFLWVMHRFAEAFQQHAILKGDMALRLYDCPRSTTDLDYVFVPFDSTKSIAGKIEETLREIEDAVVTTSMNSKVLRADIRLDNAQIQVEASVGQECPSIASGTASLAVPLGLPSHVVRIMAPDTALAHKLAAWNERRLHRDLYDVYFLMIRVGARPELAALEGRLLKIESRLPALGKTRTMDLKTFGLELAHTLTNLKQTDLDEELAPLLPAADLAGLELRIRSALMPLVEAWTT